MWNDGEAVDIEAHHLLLANCLTIGQVNESNEDYSFVNGRQLKQSSTYWKFDYREGQREQDLVNLK